MPDRSGLARKTTAADIRDDVDLLSEVGRFQGLQNEHAQSGTSEISLDISFVHLDGAGSLEQLNPGRRFSPAACGDMLKCGSF